MLDLMLALAPRTQGRYATAEFSEHGHTRWSGLLDRYLSTLVATHAEQLEAGSDAAGARTAALAAALEGVDTDELGAAWARFTSVLRGG